MKRVKGVPLGDLFVLVVIDTTPIIPIPKDPQWVTSGVIPLCSLNTSFITLIAVSLSSSATRTASWMGREILKMPTTNLSKKLACFGNTYFLETSSPKTDIRLDC